MAYTDLTLKKLFALSGNECAFPGCELPIIDTEYGVPIGQICHIKGKSPNGPRHDPNQTEAERDYYPNLLVMCAPHNKIVDDELTRNQFPVGKLAQLKKDHESRAHNRVVKEDTAERIAKIILALQPQPAPLPDLVVVVESFILKPDNEMGIDYYDFGSSYATTASLRYGSTDLRLKSRRPMQPRVPSTLQR